ncbi:MAG: hypothetical protein ACFFCP_12860 [Promethearchaeota archaeon]
MGFRTSKLQSAAKLLLVLFLPLFIDVKFVSGRLQYIHYDLIVTKSLFYSYNFFELAMNLNKTLGAFILISCPLIYFEYKVRNESSRDSVIASAMTLFLVSLVLFRGLAFFQESIGLYYWILYDVESAFTWSIFVFLVFPFLMREAKLLENHMSEFKPESVKSRINPSKYRVLGYILCIIVALTPFGFSIWSYNQQAGIYFYSNLITIDHSTLYTFSVENNIMIWTFTYLTDLLVPLKLSITTGFCVLLFRYFKGNTKKQFVIFAGLLDASLPIIGAAILQQPLLPFAAPLPLLAGLVLMKKISVVKADEYIWDEIPVHFWYEQQKVTDEEGMVLVKIPLSYVIISRLRNLRPKTNPSKSDIISEASSLGKDRSGR